MEIMKFTTRDIKAIVSLFYDTVHTVNAKDYSREQLEAWAALEERSTKIATWKHALNQNITYVAKINNKVVGFSDLTHNGHLERLYVHKDYQGMGIASALMNQLEAEAKRRALFTMDTDTSMTAKPFFQGQGYEVVCLQKIARRGVMLTNYKMMKVLSPQR